MNRNQYNKSSHTESPISRIGRPSSSSGPDIRPRQRGQARPLSWSRARIGPRVSLRRTWKRMIVVRRHGPTRCGLEDCCGSNPCSCCFCFRRADPKCPAAY
jgi:hypothetical protein